MGSLWPRVVTAAALGVPAAQAQVPAPPVPAASLPEVAPASPEPSMEERLRRLEARSEAMDRRHREEYQALQRRYDALLERVGPGGTPPAVPSPPTAAPSRGSADPGSEGRSGRPASRESGGTSRSNAGGGLTPREAAGIDASGTSARTFIRESTSRENRKRRARVEFDEGLEITSDDDEFKLTFHDLTQAEFRAFPPQDHGTLKDQFFIPRQRWYFTGQVTKSVEFYTVINRGYGPLDLLDAFITLNFLESLSGKSSAESGTGSEGTGGRTPADRGQGTDNRLRLRVGRMKTPYLYEYFSISEGDLIAPERSLYAGNLAGNRQNGAMILGDILENRLSYAAGIFNGPRRSFEDFNSDKDLFLHFNARPFLTSEALPALKYLNLGGGVNGGYEKNSLQPTAFRTANDQSTSAAASSLSPTFLAFNTNVTELGERIQWGGHVAYFYKSLMLLGQYGAGSQGYSLDRKHSTPISSSGWMVQGTYFLTGEELTRRVNVVRPLRDFGYNKGKFSIGAVEVHGRFSELDLGGRIFTAGLADPNLWSNRAYATDIGANWYLNYYTKIYFDWQHSIYGNAVTTGLPGLPGHSMRSTDLYWLRFQLFF